MSAVQGWVLAALVCTSGCNFTAFAADQAGNMAVSSADAMRAFGDYEIAGIGNASGIMQLESMHALSPDNEGLSLTLCSAYVGYAFGWVEVAAEKAEEAGDYDAADRQRKRAAYLYGRARDLALEVLRARDDGIDAAMKKKPADLRAYLEDVYDDPDEDAAPLFWAASSWGALINSSEDMGMVIHLPVITTLVEHVVKLDEGFEDAAPLVFLGGFYSQFPAQLGGDPNKGKAYFERALALTKRRALQVQLNYARLYALTVNDRALFVSLLTEVVEADDQGPEVRLANEIARVRAAQLLKKTDTLLGGEEG